MTTVERIPISRLTATHSRAAELIRRGRRLNDQLDAYFREIRDVQDALRGEGADWSPVLPALVEGASAVWTSRGPVETRLELHAVREAPIGRPAA